MLLKNVKKFILVYSNYTTRFKVISVEKGGFVDYMRRTDPGTTLSPPVSLLRFNKVVLP